MSCDKEWFNVSEAAEYLGISRQTIYNLMEEGRLTYYKVEGVRGRRVKREDLDALFKKVDGRDVETD